MMAKRYCSNCGQQLPEDSSFSRNGGTSILEQLAMSLVCSHHEPMDAYSEDLRQKIVQAVQQRHMSKSEAARAFGVSLSSVKRYVKAACEGRSLRPGKAPGKKPKLDEKARRLLEADVEERPFAKLADRQQYLQKVVGLSVSESTLSRALRKMGFGRKKGRWVPVSKTSS
jgi:transposase